jgi:hypothetical protein
MSVDNNQERDPKKREETESVESESYKHESTGQSIGNSLRVDPGKLLVAMQSEYHDRNSKTSEASDSREVREQKIGLDSVSQIEAVKPDDLTVGDNYVEVSSKNDDKTSDYAEKVETGFSEKKLTDERLGLQKEEQEQTERDQELESELEEKERQREIDETIGEEIVKAFNLEKDGTAWRLLDGAKASVRQVFGEVKKDLDETPVLKNQEFPWGQFGEAYLLGATLMFGMLGKHAGEMIEKVQESEGFKAFAEYLQQMRNR